MALGGMHKPHRLHLSNPLLPSIKPQILGLTQRVEKEVGLFCYEEFSAKGVKTKEQIQWGM